MADMSKFSPDNGLTVLNIKDAVARSSVSAQNVLLKDTVGWTGKNLLKNSAINKSTSDMSFTINSDKSVTINGTATANRIVLLTDNFDSTALAGCLANGLSNINGISYRVTSVDYATTYQIIDEDDTAIIDNGSGLGFYIRVANGTVCDNVTIYPMIRDADVTDITYEPYHKSADEYFASTELLKDTVGWVVKNYLKLSNLITSAVSYMVTDGALSVFGTTSSSNASNYSVDFDLPDGDYIFYTGYIPSDSVTTLNIFKVSQGSPTSEIAIINSASENNYIPFTVDHDGYDSLQFLIWNKKGTTFNYTCYPMVCKAEEFNGTFEPYHESADEYFAKKQLLKDTVGWIGKNLLPYPYEDTTKTVKGVTFTDNGDGSITINGTATGGSAEYILFGESGSTEKIIPPGKYKITSNDLGDNILLRPVYKIIGYSDLDNVDAVDGLSYMYVSVPNGKTVNNVTIHPMIREASITDDTYEPYHKTVEEMFDDLGTASVKNAISVVTDSSDLVESGAVKDIIGWGNKNLIGKKGGWSSQGVISPTSKAIRSNKFAVNEGNTFIASKKSALTETWSDLYALLFDGSGNFIRQELILENDILVGTPFTIPSGVGYVAFSVYVNGTDFDNITAFEIQVEKGSTATAYEPYHESVEETFADLGISVVTQSTDVVKSGAVKDIVGWGNKNLLKYPYKDSTKTINQVAFTDNGDGSITIDGTATGGDADYKFFGAWASTEKIIPEGKYKVTSNGLGDNLSIIPVYNTTGYADLDNVNAVNGLSYMFIRVPNGKTVNNVTIHPMIREASITDDTYEPYHESVEEMFDDLGTSAYKNSTSVVTDSTDLVESGAVYDAIGIDFKNLIDVTLDYIKSLNILGTWDGNVYTYNGITYTVNDDMSVTANGTANGSSRIDIASVTVLGLVTGDKYLLKGSPENSGLHKALYLSQGPNILDLGEGVLFRYDGNTARRVRIGIDANYTVNNAVYRPFLQKGNVEVRLDDKADNSVIGTVEGANASKAWSVGEHFISGGQFKEVTNPIASGEAINSGNTTDKPIADILKSYIDSLGKLQYKSALGNAPSIKLKNVNRALIVVGQYLYSAFNGNRLMVAIISGGDFNDGNEHKNITSLIKGNEFDAEVGFSFSISTNGVDEITLSVTSNHVFIGALILS